MGGCSLCLVLPLLVVAPVCFRFLTTFLCPFPLLPPPPPPPPPAEYMCPQYLSSGHYDGRAEVYSYGLVLAELLSGRVQPVEVAYQGGLQYYVWEKGE